MIGWPSALQALIDDVVQAATAQSAIACGEMLSPRAVVELTCTREVCHVVYSVDEELVSLLLGENCPRCSVGTLELRELVRPGRSGPESGEGSRAHLA